MDMALRTQAVAASPVPDRAHRMTRVLVTEDGLLYAIWVVELPNGQRAERSVPVTPALQDLITARVTFQRLLDDIASDTAPRLGA